MSSKNTICLVKDLHITRTGTSVYAKEFTWSGNPDDIAKSSQLRSLTDYIQELKNSNSHHTLAFMYSSSNQCLIWLWDGFPQGLCSILPKPFLQIQFMEEVPSTDVIDKIIIAVRLDLTKIVKNPYVTCKIHPLFKEDSSKDWTIVAGNGSEIRCHRMLFQAHSYALPAMISPNNGMLESKNGKIEMPENSEEGLSHLVRYLYGMELNIEGLSSDVALPQWQLRKGSDWYTMDDLMELYFHVKNLAEFKPIEDYILSIMLGLSKEIRSCKRLKELKRTDPDAAFELTSVFVDMLTLKK